jgi:DNA-binding NarL/FixJ family response regulator
MMHIYLPSGSLRLSPSQPRPPGGDPSGGRALEAGKSPATSVLIVEDEGLVAMNMESALSEAGFRILGVVDTEADAVEAAVRVRPDVVLMDITLRDGNGISAARKILAMLGTRIIFISGNSDPITLAAAQELKPAAFIRKPFVTERLPQLVKDALAAKN